MTETTVAIGGFPQASGAQVITDLLDQIASHFGDGDDDAEKARARKSLKRAVQKYNAVPWLFNRVTQDITLDGSGTGTDEYTLNTDFRNPLRATLVNSDSQETGAVMWVNFPEFKLIHADRRGGAAAPRRYTARNAHETGLVTFHPTPLGTLTYPTARLYYHRFIILPGDDGNKINVPESVEEGLVEMAIALYLQGRIGHNRAVRAKTDADGTFFLLSSNPLYQDHEDIEVE